MNKIITAKTSARIRTIIFILICLFIIFCIKKFKGQYDPENSENADNTLYEETAKLIGSPKYVGELKSGIPNGQGRWIWSIKLCRRSSNKKRL